MNKILLFGGGLQVLSLARGLTSKGFKVDSWADNASVGRYSNYINKFHVVSLDNIDLKTFIAEIQSYGYEVIIPTEDEYAEWLSKNKAEIEYNTKTKCAVMPYDIFSLVINKTSLLDFCRQHSIQHPITKKINPQSLKSSATGVPFPALIKPSVSNGARGIVRVDCMQKYLEVAPKIIESYGECALQEFIYNPDHYYNVMLYRYNDGTWGQHVITKITRFYPINGGSSSFCTTIDDKRILEICKRLLDKLNWIGFADFDVLEKEDGDFRIIEINPRVPASIHAALISGVDFGYMMVADLSQQSRPVMQYITGKHLRCLGLDIAWFLKSPNRFRSIPSWFNFFDKNVSFQEGGFKDLRAMTYSIYSGIKKQLSPSFRKSKDGMN